MFKGNCSSLTSLQKLMCKAKLYHAIWIWTCEVKIKFYFVFLHCTWVLWKELQEIHSYMFYTKCGGILLSKYVNQK